MANHPPMTIDLIDALVCPADKYQGFLWDGVCPNLGVRVTPNGAKSFVFDSKIRRTQIKMRITIGDVRIWSIEQARLRVKALKYMTDNQIDPRTRLKISNEKKTMSEQDINQFFLALGIVGGSITMPEKRVRLVDAMATGDLNPQRIVNLRNELNKVLQESGIES